MIRLAPILGSITIGFLVSGIHSTTQAVLLAVLLLLNVALWSVIIVRRRQGKKQTDG